jgi:vancomycin resistance protein YoaR
MNRSGIGPPEVDRRERSERQLRNPFFYFFIGGSVIFAALLLFVGVSYGRVPLRTHVAGVSLGGLRLKEARELLVRETDAFLSRPIRIEIAGAMGIQTREIAPKELGFGIDSSQTLAQFEHPSPRLILAGALMNARFPPLVTLDSDHFKTKADELFRDLEVAPVNANVLIRGNNPTEGEIVPGKPGTRADRGVLFSDLIARIETVSAKTIRVSLREDGPEIMPEDLKAPLKAWRGFIRAGSLRLELGSGVWEVASTTLAGWLKFDKEKRDAENASIGLNEKKAASFFEALRPAVEKPAVNAIVSMREGVLEEVQKPQKGYRLLVSESIESAERALRQGEHRARLVTETLEPELTLAKMRELGVTELMASGESNFAGSPVNRIHNIKVGAALFRSVLIGAGEEFSFNNLLGKVDGAHGYLPELVIKKNKTIPEYGGGLCQLSTTVFRAAAQAGVPITERQNHSFIVSYYGKPGFDATIYPGTRDFRFKNDTPGPLVLQMRPEGTRLIAELFGASDGRTVEIKGPVIYESNPDGSARAVLTRAIAKDGTRREDKFYSFYKPKALYPVERNPYE